VITAAPTDPGTSIMACVSNILMHTYTCIQTHVHFAHAYIHTYMQKKKWRKVEGRDGGVRRGKDMNGIKTP
jgi:hypothetical protein